MGFFSGLENVVGGLFGGGSNGVNWTPQSAIPTLQNPTNGNEALIGSGYVQGALGQQQNFVNALQGQNGINNQSNILGQQQGLSNQLNAESKGYGPNPALAQLSQTTGQNIASQNALMAGQRGAGQNVGLIARQAGQQGSQVQQNAVGQAAVLRAQQQLAAQQQLQTQQQNMQSVAGNQVSNLGGAIGGSNAYAQNAQATNLGALGQYNNQNVAMQSNINSSLAGINQQTAANQQNTAGGLLSGIGSALSDVLPFDKGGMVPQRMAMGGASRNNYQGSSSLGQSLMGSPIAMAAKGGQIRPQMFANTMKPVPGKASVAGNSFKNDTVPALLSPKEIVLPRSVTLSKNAPDKAKAFVQAIMAKNHLRKA